MQRIKLRVGILAFRQRRGVSTMETEGSGRNSPVKLRILQKLHTKQSLPFPTLLRLYSPYFLLRLIYSIPFLTTFSFPDIDSFFFLCESVS